MKYVGIFFGEKGEHDLSSYQTCIGYECQTCYKFFGEGDSYLHSFYYGECENCFMLESEYECLHEPYSEQTCLGYLCKHCWEEYGEGNDNHNLTNVAYCKGYYCYNCNGFVGEVDLNNHRWHYGKCEFCEIECEHAGGFPTCKGQKCDVCESWYGETNENNHVWYYGSCYYHDVDFPSDLECDHNWNDWGKCEVCGYSCEHNLVTENGVCEVCEHIMDFSVTTDGITTYYSDLNKSLEEAVDGSYLKLHTNSLDERVELNKAIIFDINGKEVMSPTFWYIYVYANVTFIDSVGGGYVEYGIDVFSECTFLSGSFRYIAVSYTVEGLRIKDLLDECSVIYTGVEGLVEDLNVAIVHNPLIKSNHSLIQTCVGNICEVCNDVSGEKDLNKHKFENYQISSEAKCEVNAKETGVCIYCETVTDTRDIENTMLEHVDENKDHICDNECGKTNVCEHLDTDTNYLCDYCSLEVAHNMSEYKYDNEGHWKECNNDGCDEKTTKEAHSLSDWNVVKEATEQEKGLKVRNCSCGYKEEEEIPVLEVPTPTPTPTPTPDPVKKGCKGSLVVSMFGMVTLLGACLTFKRKKD